mmetsp:Transcript_15788/g.28453  ORF Transcript_15788/g.28453 Transcript_15788/m.28453 type:complete len:276 (+) Transcript_15788:900-1727(+)
MPTRPCRRSTRHRRPRPWPVAMPALHRRAQRLGRSNRAPACARAGGSRRRPWGSCAFRASRLARAVLGVWSRPHAAFQPRRAVCAPHPARRDLACAYQPGFGRRRPSRVDLCTKSGTSTASDVPPLSNATSSTGSMHAGAFALRKRSSPFTPILVVQDGFLQVSLKKMVRIKGVVCVGAPCGGGCVAVGVTVWRPDVRWVAAVADWSVPAWGHRPARFGRSQKRRVYIEKEDEKCEVGWGGRGGGSQMLRHYIEMTQKKCEFETVGGGGWVRLPP